MDDKEKINHNAVNTLISLRDAADLEAESIEQGTSYDELCEERKTRTFQTMEVSRRCLVIVQVDLSFLFVYMQFLLHTVVYI